MAIPLFGSENGFAFALIAVYTALVAFATAILSRKARTKPQGSSAGGLIHFVRRGLVLVGMVLAFGFADIAAISFMPLYFIKIGHSESFAAFSVTIVALPAAVAQPLVGMLLDKISRPAVATTCALVAAFSFTVIPYFQSQFAILVVFAIMGAASFALYTCALPLRKRARCSAKEVCRSSFSPRRRMTRNDAHGDSVFLSLQKRFSELCNGLPER